MKKTFLTVMVMFMTLSATTTFVSCRENKTTGEKIEDAADDVGDGIEDAADDVEDAVD
ncbi:hypothetical protein [Neptunitalea lumnitzerae]|uniref:Uncharacterized protein n=1 Tax=Neptunitalea lumnitzerae TaxID=2965509 RepID=A0ABQ5MHY0_9FLAO|nr:hypothetical protein [Neptunitalea sp. Y10]GLB49004.1 hypothetical protein Y10_13720 [Neptunitalea sp. Y10]